MTDVRLIALALVTSAVVTAVFVFVPPVPQWPEYHDFADRRAWLGIPGFFDVASNALHDLSLRPQGKKMLVPLTASLYVPGTLDDADKVLVDVGTGYFIEKTMAEGKDYCERKINLLKSNYDQLLEVATKKKSIADEAGAILQAKLKQLAPTP